MSGLINHEKTQNNPLDNEKHIEYAEQQGRADIVKDEEKKQDGDKKEPDFEQVTIPRNLRVDNHIANQVQALINIGFADDAKGVIYRLVNDKINSLQPGDQERISSMVKMLEIKDYYSQQSKGL